MMVSMRIISGAAKGRRLSSTKTQGIRPTSNLVRGAIYSILGAEAVVGAKILDLYSGTGALGLEALSRGAAWVDFVEQSRTLSRHIQASLVSLGFSEKASVYSTNVEGVLDSLPGDYDIVFMDPPYESQSIQLLLPRMNRVGFLKVGGTIVAEHSRLLTLQEVYGKLRQTKHRRYGDTCLSVFRLGDPDE